MKNILIGIDFHEETDKLIDRTYEIVKPHNSKIWLLHAEMPGPDAVSFEVGPGFIRDYRAEGIEIENELLSRFTEQLRKKGADAEGLVVVGPTIDVVFEESKKLNIDLIVFGHHKHNFLYTMFFGSTSTDVIKKSDIPVLIIPLIK